MRFSASLRLCVSASGQKGAEIISLRGASSSLMGEEAVSTLYQFIWGHCGGGEGVEPGLTVLSAFSRAFLNRFWRRSASVLLSGAGRKLSVSC